MVGLFKANFYVSSRNEIIIDVAEINKILQKKYAHSFVVLCIVLDILYFMFIWLFTFFRWWSSQNLPSISQFFKPSK